MSTTMHLPYVRFVRQVSNGCARSKYAFKGMMAENLQTLKATPWRRATCLPNEVTTTVNAIAATDKAVAEDGSVTAAASYTQYLNDRYDAFKQGGDASRQFATMCGYAGMVAYRFQTPYSSYHDLAGAVNSITLPLLRDRYCRSGLRVAVVISSDETPSDDWATIRGETTGAGKAATPSTPATGVDGVTSWGALSQPDTAHLLASATAYETLTFDFSNFNNCEKYVWVYISIEDYCDYWSLYDKATPRYYAIEGSAMLDAPSANFTFGGTVAADTPTWYEADIWTSPVDMFNATSYTAEQVAAFGSVLKCLPHSAVFTHQSAFAVMQNLDSLPVKSIFSEPYSNSYISTSDPVLASEVGVLASVPNKFTASGSGYTPDTTDMLRGEIDVEWFEPARNTAGGMSGADGKVSVHGAVNYRYSARVVPPNAPCYTKMRMAVSGSGAGIAGNADFDLLIWKLSGADIFGAFAQAALVAVATNTAFFTGSRRTISGTFAGDGTLPVEVSASARLLQCVELDIAEVPATIDIQLNQPVSAGDVLAFVLRLRSVGTRNNLPFVGFGGYYALGTPVISFSE